MNIVKIKEELLNYLKRNFNMEDPNILRKYEHTQWVATYCYDIAKELNLNEEQKNLAYVLGLFHDYGRFTQWVRYGTYNDKLSYPHAELGVELLFGNNEIENFSVPKKYYNLLKIVILQHSKLEINKSITNNEQLLFCKIIRDADKVNLYELNIDGTLPTFTNLDGVTKEVLQSVEGCKCVNNIFVKTKLDRALLSLASTYDLNFAFSYKKLEDMQYFEKMATRFEKILNKEDNVILLKAIDVIKTNLQKIKQKNKTIKQNK
ncbi:MAG: HD domain-containing protein [Christensenellales bacterium]|mgnify:FL=1|jgi:hypothetical protein